MKYRYTVTVQHEGKEWAKSLEKIPFIIGREKADIVIASNIISRQQLKVGRDEEGIWIEDLGSKNGTFIDDSELAPKTRVHVREGQLIEIGDKLGLSLTITAKELVESKVIELPKRQTNEIQHVQVANGPFIKLDSRPAVAVPDTESVEKNFSLRSGRWSVMKLRSFEKNLLKKQRK